MASHVLNPIGQSKLQGQAQSQGARHALHPPSGHGKAGEVSFSYRKVKKQDQQLNLAHMAYLPEELSLGQVLTLEHTSESSGILVSTQMQDPTEFLTQLVWSRI